MAEHCSGTVEIAINDRSHVLTPLADSLGFLLRVLQIQLTEQLRTRDVLPISPASSAALQLIAANPGIRQVDAARILVIQRSNFATLVKALVANGFIERRGTDRDKRGGLWITETGLVQLSKLRSVEDSVRGFSDVLSPGAYRQMMDSLVRLYVAGLA